MKGSEMPDTRTAQIEQFAQLISNMRFDTLMEISESLSGMLFPDNDEDMFWDLKKPSEWAQMLHAWSESYIVDGGAE